jgi:hypothetical protein
MTTRPDTKTYQTLRDLYYILPYGINRKEAIKNLFEQALVEKTLSMKWLEDVLSVYTEHIKTLETSPEKNKLNDAINTLIKCEKKNSNHVSSIIWRLRSSCNKKAKHI